VLTAEGIAAIERVAPYHVENGGGGNFIAGCHRGPSRVDQGRLRPYLRVASADPRPRLAWVLVETGALILYFPASTFAMLSLGLRLTRP